MIHLSEDDVREVARLVLDAPVIVDHWSVDDVGYESSSPATGALCRVRGETTDGRSWSVFVKLLQHVRHWPLLTRLPEQIRESFAADFPWQQEMVVWDESFRRRFPPGMRAPKLYLVTQPGEDRLLLWMEDVNAVD